MKSKIKDLITAIIIQLVLTLPFYTANVYGLAISNVKVAKVTSNSATIEWNTDNISDGKVRYGQTAALGFTQRHDNFVSNHTINIFNGIDSNTEYFFAVESKDLAGNNAVDNNSNSFYKFRTPDITPPPQVTGLKAASSGSSSIFLSWDNISISDFGYYNIYRNRVLIGNSTANSFNDTGLGSSADFNYKVSAVDSSGNEGPQSDTVIVSTLGVDSTAPVISSINAFANTDTTAKVTWLTNENSTSAVFYGINKTDKFKDSNDLVINHSLLIDGLAKDAQVTFIVKSCDASNNCANSSNQSFKGGKDITPPFINLVIPRFVNRRIIDVAGSTEPFSSITLFVNEMNIPKRSLSSNEVGSSGKFTFSQVQLQQDNVIKIIAVDKSGNKNQKIFETSIDTDNPVVQLKDVPPLVSRQDLAISGSVNEPVTIKVFMDANANESSSPPQITDLNATKVGKNSIELHWNESKDKDFSHYVVYREDASPIAITKPANFNLFIDALVDSGKSYTYQVSAVNIFGKEGPKSEPITATTLKDGEILNLVPPEVDILEDFRKPLIKINTSSAFNFTLKLNKGDTNYKIKLIFEDRAENSVLIEKSVTLDTKKPELRITSPPAGAFIFENVAHEVDILGKTKPNSRVHLFVDRTPFSLFNQSLDLSGLPNQIEDLPEAQLDAKCTFNVASKSLCGTGADFSVNADSEGNFKFEKVDLTRIFGGAARLTEVPVTSFRDTILNPENQESKTKTLVVIATDQVGHRGVITQSIRIGTCWSGNQSWDVVPMSQYQGPPLLNTQNLAEGTEAIYFYFKYNYIGRGTNGKITDVSLSRACSTNEISDSRFNISCQIMPSGNSPIKLNKPENTVSWSAVALSRFPNMDRFLENDWKGFFKAINNEMTFPFKVRIQYEHDVIDDSGQSVRVRETQTTCEQVTYVVDNTVINPRKVLPDWLLFDAVDILQSSIKIINDVQEQLNKIIDYVAIGCLYSIAAHGIFKIWRIWTELMDEKLFAKVLDAASLKFNLGSDDKNNGCKEIMDAVKKGYGSFKLNYLSDADLEKCFPSSASAWKTETKLYQAQRWTCDRIFGHSAPSAWTETVDDVELNRKITTEKTCASDIDTKGLKLRVESCRGLPSKYLTISKNPQDIPINYKCFLITDKDGKSQHAYRLSDDKDQEPGLVSNKIYKIESYELGRFDIIYAIKINEDLYMTSQQKTCDEICRGTGAQYSSTSTIKVNGQDVTISEDKKISTESPIKLEQKEQKDTPTRISGCITVNQCREWITKSNSKEGGFVISGIIPGKNEILKGYTVKREGYTKGCFFNPDDPNLKDIKVISETDQNTRKECCCVNGKTSSKDVYYQPLDKDPKLIGTAAEKYVHQSKSQSGMEPQSKPVPVKEGEANKEQLYSDMDWSYRYWKIGYLGKKYNPSRYITGRDQYACFGQNNLYYQLLGKEKEILIVDPAKQDFAKVIPCVYLVGVNQWLQRIKIIAGAMSKCLTEVRTSGRADSGVCKEIMTQHLCDAVWQVLRLAVDSCTPDYSGPGDSEGREARFTDDIRLRIKGIMQGISEAQKEISEDYSNVKLNDFLGAGESDISRKLCLVAFGYDWSFNVKNLIDAAYSAPSATLVQAITRSREFLTIEPVTLRPRYRYSASWIINPGCDLEKYDIKLACVSRQELDKYPDQISCASVGAPSIAYTGRLAGTSPSQGYSQCDCLDLDKEQIAPLTFFTENNIKQNTLVDKSEHKIVESERRYDHLKFILRTDRKILPSAKSNCFPTGYEDGIFYFPITDKNKRDILDCTVDLLSGTFNCGSGVSFFSRKGIAELVEVTINERKAEDGKTITINVGEGLSVGARVRKTGQDKCIKISLSSGEIQPRYELITENKIQDIGPLLMGPLLTTGRLPQVSQPTGISVIGADLNVEKQVGITVKFWDFDFDTKPGIELSETSNDKVKIGTDGIKDVKEYINKDGKFIYEGPNFKIQIVGVQIPTNNEGRPITENIDLGNGMVKYPVREGTITISPAGQAPGPESSQRKRVIVELMHTREDSQGSPGGCNDDDKILKKEYTIIVQPRGSAPGEKGPSIGKPSVDKLSARKGDLITIKSKITDSFQVDSAKLVLTAPDGKEIPIDSQQPLNNDYSFIFDTSSKADIAGKYKGKIIATNRNSKSSETPIQDFEIQCGGFGNGLYGVCKEQCPDNNRLETDIKCLERFDDDGKSLGNQFCCR